MYNPVKVKELRLIVDDCVKYLPIAPCGRSEKYTCEQCAIDYSELHYKAINKGAPFGFANQRYIFDKIGLNLNLIGSKDKLKEYIKNDFRSIFNSLKGGNDEKNNINVTTNDDNDNI